MPKLSASDTAAAVDAFVAAMEHPHVDVVRKLREVIYAASPRIAEGVKWNAPSWRVSEYFATTHLRAKTGVGLVLHLGAKVQPNAVRIEDPRGLLEWLGKDRAMVKIGGLEELREIEGALQAIVRQWIGHLPDKI